MDPDNCIGFGCSGGAILCRTSCAWGWGGLTAAPMWNGRTSLSLVQCFVCLCLVVGTAMHAAVRALAYRLVLMLQWSAFVIGRSSLQVLRVGNAPSCCFLFRHLLQLFVFFAASVEVPMARFEDRAVQVVRQALSRVQREAKSADPSSARDRQTAAEVSLQEAEAEVASIQESIDRSEQTGYAKWARSTVKAVTDAQAFVDDCQRKAAGARESALPWFESVFSHAKEDLALKTAYAQSKRAFEGHAEHEAKRVRLSEALANLQQAAAGVRKARIFLNRAGALQKKLRSWKLLFIR